MRSMNEAHAPKISRRRLTIAAALLPMARHSRAQAPADAALAAAVDLPQRTPAYRLRDAARHPLQTLQFFGLLPTHTVVEVAPGGGWYTEILAPYLREQGLLVCAHAAKDAADAAQRRSRERFEQKLSAAPAVDDRVRVCDAPVPGRGFAHLHLPGGADRVLTFRNIHNWLEDGHLDASLRAFFEVLKPGGELGVVEHRARPGTTLADFIKTGYVSEEFVKARARAAGFEWVAGSEVNANPRDSKDHVNGVWSLPPSLRGGDLERERFLAIGESDRMTLRFRRPLT
jgi:predicted methyltransferase